MLPNFRDHTRTSISKLIQHYTQVEVVVGLKKQFLLDQKNFLAMRSSKQPSDFCHLFSLVKFIQEVTIHFMGLKLSATSKQLSCFRKLHFSQFLTRALSANTQEGRQAGKVDIESPVHRADQGKSQASFYCLLLLPSYST